MLELPARTSIIVNVYHACIKAIGMANFNELSSLTTTIYVIWPGPIGQGHNELIMGRILSIDEKRNVTSRIQYRYLAFAFMIAKEHVI